MRGCRPLTAAEVRQVMNTFQGRYQERDRALFVLGVCAGFRISEMLSLKVRDVVQNSVVTDRVSVRRCNTKGKKQTRDVKLLDAAREALFDWIQTGLKAHGFIFPDIFLFKSQVGGNKPISRRHAYRILKDNFERNCITGKVGTHTMRKTYADFLYRDLVERRAKGEPVDPYPLTARGLGHLNMGNTEKYLSFQEEDIEKSMESFESVLFR